MSILYYLLVQGSISSLVVVVVLFGINFIFLWLIYFLLSKYFLKITLNAVGLAYAFVGVLAGRFLYYDLARFLLNKCPSYCPYSVMLITLLSVFVSSVIFFLLVMILFKRMGPKDFIALILMGILNVFLFLVLRYGLDVFTSIYLIPNP